MICSLFKSTIILHACLSNHPHQLKSECYTVPTIIVAWRKQKLLFRAVLQEHQRMEAPQQQKWTGFWHLLSQCRRLSCKRAQNFLDKAHSVHVCNRQLAVYQYLNKHVMHALILLAIKGDRNHCPLHHLYLPHPHLLNPYGNYSWNNDRNCFIRTSIMDPCLLPSKICKPYWHFI